MITKINHVGIVVDNYEASKKLYGEEGLGLKYLREEENHAHGCKIAFFQCGEVMIEIITPIGPGLSQKFLAEHGPGLHHICYETSDIDAEFNKAKTVFDTDYTQPVPGAGGTRVFFLKPESIGNVETEFTNG
ncbi:MAG: VOC family protein [Firmicutes bacterium]|nr:VOC family protein [Bacillota bacterium]